MGIDHCNVRKWLGTPRFHYLCILKVCLKIIAYAIDPRIICRNSSLQDSNFSNGGFN